MQKKSVFADLAMTKIDKLCHKTCDTSVSLFIVRGNFVKCANIYNFPVLYTVVERDKNFVLSPYKIHNI